MIAKVGFKMFLGVTASVMNWDADGTCCSIVLEDNPLVDFVELPDTCQGLYYCNILSGVIRGALEMVAMKTEVTWIRDMLRGDDAYELQVKLLKQVPEEYPYKDDEVYMIYTPKLLMLLILHIGSDGKWVDWIGLGQTKFAKRYRGIPTHWKKSALVKAARA
ncbi:hypothetical protein Goari_025798, partial [Gossypium aridum]|nr:hypothetical protein [Gossypium aridum]